MALIIEKKSAPGNIYPVVYRHAEVLPGGYRIMNTLPAGYTITRGTYVAIEHDKLRCNICKIGRVIAGGTSQSVRVEKGHPFVAGDVVMLSGKKQAEAIKSINTNNAEYDEIAFATGLDGAAAVGVLIEADKAGESSAPKFVANGFVDREKKYDGEDTAVSVAFRGVLISGNVDTPSEYRNGVCLKGNPNIVIVAQ